MTKKKPCLVGGCPLKEIQRGRCRRHLAEWKQQLGGVFPLPPSRDQRFWAKVDRRADDECWHWLGALNRYGYGHLLARVYGTAQAHRFAYELVVGPIPDGMQLDHLCHTHSDCKLGKQCLHRRCVNPAHLEIVTAAENTRRGHFRAAPQGAVCV